uniref:Uncharacterized protein n=1 Tax=Psilocybe cubensis TaxID=181762 RepID=A0A8H8CNG8_PSICU
MTAESPLTWQSITLEQIPKLHLWQLIELSEARKRDLKAENVADRAKQRGSFEDQSAQHGTPTTNDNVNSRLEPRVAECSTAGPSRSPKRSVKGHPYSRSARGKTSNRKAVIAEGRSPTSVALNSTSGSGYNDAAQEEAIREILEVINQYNKELTELENQHNDVLQTAVNARLISARLKEKILFERKKTDKLVGFLTRWQKSHLGSSFDELPVEEPLEPEHAIDEELGADMLARLKRDFEKVLTKKQFSQLKRRFVAVEQKKKRQQSRNTDGSPAVTHVGTDAISNKRKGKAKGKEKDSGHDEASAVRNKGKGKGKAKEVDMSALSPAAKKRLVSDYLKENPAILRSIEESDLNLAIERSRNDILNGGRSGGNSSGHAGASGSRAHSPKASGSGTRRLDNVVERGRGIDAVDEEHPRKRRRIHLDTSEPSPPKDSSPPSFLAKTLSFAATKSTLAAILQLDICLSPSRMISTMLLRSLTQEYLIFNGKTPQDLSCALLILSTTGCLAWLYLIKEIGTTEHAFARIGEDRRISGELRHCWQKSSFKNFWAGTVTRRIDADGNSIADNVGQMVYLS